MRIKLLIISFAMCSLTFTMNAQDEIFWSSSSANGEWDWGAGCNANNGGNWWWTTSGSGARQRPDCFSSFNKIFFDNNVNTIMNLNSDSDYSVNQIQFLSGTSDRTINTNAGRRIFFQNNNGNCKIENYVAVTTHTFNVDIFVNSGGNNMEINPVNGFLYFNNTITNNSNNPINIYGAQQVTFAGNITGNPGVTINSTATVVYSGTTKTYTGTTTINSGTKLKISTNQTLGNIALNGGTLEIDAGVLLTISGTYTSTGGTINNKGTIKFAGGSVTFPGSATVNNGVANTLTNFEVASPATVILSSSFNVAGTFIVSAGGILEFNEFDLLGSGKFTLSTTGTLKITSPNGVNADGNTTGNIRCSGARVFSQTGYYHYVGNSSPQFTGTAITSGSTAKQIVINKTNATDIVNLTQSTGTTGFLQISKGIFVESATSGLTGSGDLTIDTWGTYKIAITGNTVPQISGTYTLSGNSTLELNGSGTQELRGSKSYRNLVFSNSGTKSISSAITGTNTITGTVTIKDAAILDVENKSFGDSGTNLAMNGTSEFKTAGTGVKPDMGGTYTLGVGTKISFTNNAGTLQSIRLAPNYYNIDVVGSSVGTNTLATAIKIQNGGTFTVKSTGIFKHSNTTGFSAGTNTAISSTNNPTITLEQGSTIEYAGDNQSITLAPVTTTYSNLKVSGTGTKKIPTELFLGNDLLVKEAALQIESNKTLIVTNKVSINPAATVTINSSGSLVQVNDDPMIINTGNITYERNYTGGEFDYTYWSSPVFGQNLLALSPETKLDKFFSFNAVANDWLPENPITETMEIGKGYIIRGSPPIPGPPVGFATSSFVGIPNNGIITSPISWNGASAGTSNLIGNPYPSAIDADIFLSLNSSVIEGTIYFWTHNTAMQLRSVIIAAGATPGSEVFAYTSDDYASYNITGGVGVAAPSASTGGANTNIPNGKITAGQAFFTTSLLSNGTVTFNNSMRLDNTNNVLDNSQFFKTRNPKTKTAAIEKHRIWLNLRNTQGVFKQTLVGYITDATNQYENRFDGISFDTHKFADFYSVNQDKNLVIQGRALPFDENDEVPLGFRTTIDGVFTINIDQTDGILTNQSVFIEDKLTNTIFDLRSGAYTFATTSGTFNDRFVLRYTNKTLGAKDVDALENQVLVSTKNKQIKINSPIEIIDKVTVYDLLGRQLFKKEKVNNNELAIPNFVPSQQTLIVKVSLQNGQTVTRKIVY